MLVDLLRKNEPKPGEIKWVKGIMFYEECDK